MESTQVSRSERWARAVRFALLSGIAALSVLIVASVSDGAKNPFRIKDANAELISAAPGFIAMTSSIGTGVNFYLIDTNVGVICVYQMDGDKIRLVAARDFTHDTDIVDGSLNVVAADGKQLKAFEGGSGLDKKDAEAYAEALKKLIESAEKK
ncbi:MAG: hypothetical protein KIS92_23670 [Planctomycetota bacterium]|nr:hypothetical protein [Planctomycetota bacterium]